MLKVTVPEGFNGVIASDSMVQWRDCPEGLDELRYSALGLVVPKMRMSEVVITISSFAWISMITVSPSVALSFAKPPGEEILTKSKFGGSKS